MKDDKDNVAPINGSDDQPEDTDKPEDKLIFSAPSIHLDIFEGPLDLLLYLIRKNEYDIFDIPISEITEQYLHYIEVLQSLDLEVAGDFLVMAATLMKIKSRMLLPRPELNEEGEEEDPRAALIKQLLEYQRYKEAAEQLQDRPVLGRDVFARKFESPELAKAESEESYLEVDMYDLIEALRSVLKGLPEDKAYTIRFEPYSVRERISQLVDMLKGLESITFQELFTGATQRIEVVTTFLAMLEMVRLQLLRIYQAETHGNIRIMPMISNETEPVPAGEIE